MVTAKKKKKVIPPPGRKVSTEEARRNLNAKYSEALRELAK